MPEPTTTTVEPLVGNSRWKNGPIPVIGLTGAVGGGKSAAASLLAARGAAVIDADGVGHAVLRRPEIVARLADRFGSEILADDGSINRRSLGRLVFADAAARRDLEAIVHPPMCERFRDEVETAQRDGKASLIVLDAAILLEAGWDSACDLIVFIDALRTTRLDRVQRSRGWTEDQLKAREDAQWPTAVKADRADLVLHNDGDLKALATNIDRLLAMLGVSPPPPRS